MLKVAEEDEVEKMRGRVHEGTVGISLIYLSRGRRLRSVIRIKTP